MSATLAVRRPHPHKTNPQKEEKEKILKTKRERLAQDNKTLLLILENPTVSNTVTDIVP